MGTTITAEHKQIAHGMLDVEAFSRPHTKEVIEVLMEGKPQTAYTEGLKALTKSAAKNCVKAVRKSLGQYIKSAPHSTDWERMRAATEFKKRQKKVEQQALASLEVVKKNHKQPEGQVSA